MAYMRPTVRQLRDEQKRTIAAGLEAEQWRTELNRMADRLGLVLDELGAPRTQANEQFGLSLEGRIRKLARAAVAEARAPLVAALRAALHALTTYQGLWATDECRDGGDYSFQLSDTALLDQITDILGPPTGQPEAGDATEMHGV